MEVALVVITVKVCVAVVEAPNEPLTKQFHLFDCQEQQCIEADLKQYVVLLFTTKGARLIMIIQEKSFQLYKCS